MKKKSGKKKIKVKKETILKLSQKDLADSNGGTCWAWSGSSPPTPKQQAQQTVATY